jgi:hypothetical protein
VRQTIYAASIVYLCKEPVFQLYVLLSTSILYNCVLAMSRPYLENYNMVLHYVNEFSFFFFLAMSMTFTDFVTDIPTRTRTGSMLSTFMFLVLSLNVLIALIAIIWTKNLFKSDASNSAVVPSEEAEVKPKRGISKVSVAMPDSSERVAFNNVDDFQLQQIDDEDRPRRMSQLLIEDPSPSNFIDDGKHKSLAQLMQEAI